MGRVLIQGVTLKIFLTTSTVGRMHRRKTSKEEDEGVSREETPEDRQPTPEPPVEPNGQFHTRSHTLPSGLSTSPRLPSSPSRNHVPTRAPSLNVYDRPPLSASSNRQTFGSLAPPPAPSLHRHNRVPSVYEPLYGNPPSAGPTRTTFGIPTSPTKSPAPPSPYRTGFPPPSPSTGSSGTSPQKQSLQPGDPRRRSHARVHSRNLSVYFPRPGAAPGGAVASIAEDGDDAEGQEIEVGGGSEAPVHLIPAPRFSDGFKFGGLPMEAGGSSESESAAPKRRGCVAFRAFHSYANIEYDVGITISTRSLTAFSHSWSLVDRMGLNPPKRSQTLQAQSLPRPGRLSRPFLNPHQYHLSRNPAPVSHLHHTLYPTPLDVRALRYTRRMKPENGVQPCGSFHQAQNVLLYLL